MKARVDRAELNGVLRGDDECLQVNSNGAADVHCVLPFHVVESVRLEDRGPYIMLKAFAACRVYGWQSRAGQGQIRASPGADGAGADGGSICQGPHQVGRGD